MESILTNARLSSTARTPCTRNKEKLEYTSTKLANALPSKSFEATHSYSSYKPSLLSSVLIRRFSDVKSVDITTVQKAVHELQLKESSATCPDEKARIFSEIAQLTEMITELKGRLSGNKKKNTFAMYNAIIDQKAQDLDKRRDKVVRDLVYKSSVEQPSQTVAVVNSDGKLVSKLSTDIDGRNANQATYK